MAFSGLSFPALKYGNKFRGTHVQLDLPVSVVRNGGYEYRTLRFGYPRRIWTIPARMLAPEDVATLRSFFNQVGGSLQSFLFTDYEENTLSGYSLGAGTQLAVPGAPTISGGGTGLPAGTYTYGITALNAQGETPMGPTTSFTSATSFSASISWAPVPGATAYRVYGRVAGSLGLLQQVTSPVWNSDTGAASPGAAPPTVNTTGTLQYPVLVALDGLDHPLLHLNGLTVSPSNGVFSVINGVPTLTFPVGSAPAYGSNVTLTGTFSLAARFDMTAGWALQNAAFPTLAPMQRDTIKLVEVFE